MRASVLTATRDVIARRERNFQQRFGFPASAFIVCATVIAMLGAKEYPIFASLLLQTLFVAATCVLLRKRVASIAMGVAGNSTSQRSGRWMLLALEIAAFGLLAAGVAYAVFSAWSRLAPNANVLLAGRLPFVLVHSGFITAFVLVPHLIKRFQSAEAAAVARQNQERLRIASLERSLALSQLKTLQAQIEPHFLYNVLANVQAMVKLAPDTADAMLMHLIDYLKLAMPSMRGEQSSVKAELDLARAYLAIAQLRFGERLHVRVHDAAALGHMSMPPMLLLPLVENAVKHGVEPKPGVVSVSVDVSALHDELVFLVTDDGAGFAHDAGSGIGIANVRDRLAALFKEAASVVVEPREGGGVKATLSIPIRHE
jgi:sensor histidine kinase YesM